MLDFRPHHLLCILGFDGDGPSRAFVENYQAIRTHLEPPHGKRVPIRVVFGVDDLCSACPGRHGRICEMDDVASEVDRLHAEILELKEGEILSWGEARRRLLEHADDPRFDVVADLCPWDQYGGCHRGLEVLRAEARRVTTATQRIAVSER